jgi:hypothetical protein
VSKNKLSKKPAWRQVESRVVQWRAVIWPHMRATSSLQPCDGSPGVRHESNWNRRLGQVREASSEYEIWGSHWGVTSCSLVDR